MGDNTLATMLFGTFRSEPQTGPCRCTMRLDAAVDPALYAVPAVATSK